MCKADYFTIAKCADRSLNDCEELSVHVCLKVGCRDPYHLSNIAALYDNLCYALKEASQYFSMRIS